MQIVRGNDIKLEWVIYKCDPGEPTLINMNEAEGLQVKVRDLNASPTYEWSIDESGRIIVSLSGTSLKAGSYHIEATWQMDGQNMRDEVKNAITVINSSAELTEEYCGCDRVKSLTIPIYSTLSLGVGEVDLSNYYTIGETNEKFVEKLPNARLLSNNEALLLESIPKTYQEKLIEGDNIRIVGNIISAIVESGTSGITFPKNILIVAPNSKSAEETGDLVHPYKTIQKAIENRSGNEIIAHLGGESQEDVVIENITGLLIFAGSALIKGSLTIKNSSRVTLWNITFSEGFTEESSSELRFENIDIKGDTVFNGNTDSTKYHLINGSQFGTVTVNGNRKTRFWNCMTHTAGTPWTTNHIDSVLFLDSVNGPGIIHHKGEFRMDGSTNLGTLRGNICIESDCNGADGYLRLENGTLKQEDHSLGIIYKSGTCTWYPGKTNYEAASSLLNGSRDVLGGLQAEQVSYRYDPKGYARPLDVNGNPISLLSGHIQGVDNELIAIKEVVNSIKSRLNQVSEVKSDTQAVEAVISLLPAVDEITYFSIKEDIFNELGEELVQELTSKGYTIKIG